MNHSIYQLLWYFLLYSFVGWCLEIVYAAVRKKRFVNRGILNGPLCPVYGLGMVFSFIFFRSLTENFVFLAIGCGAIATVLEFFTGMLLEKLFKKKWWDYSDYKYNLGGYVCLPFSIIWGITAALAIKFAQPLFQIVLDLIPVFLGQIVLIAAFVIIGIDVISVMGIIFEVQKYNKKVEDLAESMQQISNKLGRKIFLSIERRMTKAHPPVEVEAPSKQPKEKDVFAYGCSFYKLIWLFFIGAFLGDVIETIFCRFSMGRWMSRSSVVYGDFSIVWGLGVVVLTAMLYRYKDKKISFIFLFGTVMGGAYEYICSVFTEIVFGTVFWDYSKIPFNLGGRINLLFCFFWGVAAVLWIKFIYIKLSALIEKVPKKLGKILSWVMIVFMIFNMLISAAALDRYTHRSMGQKASTEEEKLLDEYFPDERMEKVYPSAIMRNGKK
ncbi:MAG: putative ABC transporter permease [Clostridiales bacterium]|nr:putative ABC transporter permease [Clostridiales bacterium]